MKNDVIIMNLDKPRVLKFGNKALKKIEKILNCKISKIEINELGIEELEKIVHAGLLHEDAELALEKVVDLLDEHMVFGNIIKTVTEGFLAAYGTNLEENPNEIRIVAENQES
jgi:hypothetical protein